MSTSHLTTQVERTRSRRVLTPRVDIVESHDDIVLWADMPGVDERSVEILLEHDVLTLEGKTPAHERADAQPWLTERVEADYRRVFTLSTEVDRDCISAEVKDGVLKVVLPKAEPAKVKKITVHAG